MYPSLMNMSPAAFPGNIGGLIEHAVQNPGRGIALLGRLLAMLAAEHHGHMAFGVEPHLHIRALIHGPDVIVAVDANGMGPSVMRK